MKLTAENTAIVLDSTADFPEAPERFPNWRIVPLYVRFGAESYRDYVDLGPAEFYERLRSADELPTTSQPTPARLPRASTKSSRGYERVLSLHLSAKLSGTLRQRETAAAESGGRVRVIDSGTRFGGDLDACARRSSGGSSAGRPTKRWTARRPVPARARALFTVDTLEYLARGGRIGRARALAGQLLHIKPILTIARRRGAAAQACAW